MGVLAPVVDEHARCDQEGSRNVAILYPIS